MKLNRISNKLASKCIKISLSQFLQTEMFFCVTSNIVVSGMQKQLSWIILLLITSQVTVNIFTVLGWYILDFSEENVATKILLTHL